MDLSYILHRAWQITRRHKVLWLFGFALSLGTVGRRIATCGSGWEQPARGLPSEVQRAIADLSHIPYFVAAVIALILLGITTSIGLALLGALGRAAMVNQIQAAENRGRVQLRAGWQAGKRHLRPVFLIRLLLGLPAAAPALIGALPAIGTGLIAGQQARPEVAIPGAMASVMTFLTCLLPGVCLALLLSVPLGVLQRLAVRACVLEGHSVRESILRAWTILREHTAPLALLWLILTGIGIGVTIAFGLPLTLLAIWLWTIILLVFLTSPLWLVPLMSNGVSFLSILNDIGDTSNGASLALTAIIGLLAWLVGAGVNSVMATFLSASWTLAYRELTGLGLTGENTSTILKKADTADPGSREGPSRSPYHPKKGHDGP